MSTVTEATTVVAAEDTLSTTLDGESVLLHTGSGTYYGFNDVGTEIWAAVQEPRSVPEVVEHVVDGYDVSAAECRADVESLLEELIEHDLVDVVEE